MEYFLKLNEEPIILTLPARKMTCFSIMSVLCHRETPWRLCVCVCADGIHRSPPFMPCELLMPFLSISHRYPTAFDKAAIIKPRFFFFFFFDSELHNLQIDKRRRSYFWEKHKSIKSPQIVRRTRIDRDFFFFFFFCHIGDVRCGVLYGTSTFHPHFADLNRHWACCSSCCHSNISIYPVRQLYK